MRGLISKMDGASRLRVSPLQISGFAELLPSSVKAEAQ